MSEKKPTYEELEQLVEELRDRETQLNSVQKIAKLGFWDLNLVTGSLYWSDETYIHFGFNPKEFEPTYERFRGVVHPDDIDFVHENVDAAIKSSKEYKVEFRIIRPDGEIRHIATSGEAYRDNNGTAIRFIGTQSDITEYKMVEKKLGFLNLIAEQITESVIVIDLDFKIIYVNNATLNAFGYSKEEMIGAHPDILNAEPLSEAIQQEIYKIVSKGDTWSNTLLNKRKDGSTFYNEFYVNPMFDDEGNIVSYMSIQRDITERKETEEQLIQNKEFLARSQAVAHVGSWHLDLKTNALTWSDENFRIFGFEPGEVEANYETFISCVHPDDRDFVNKAYNTAIETNTPYECTHRILRRDGTVITVYEVSEEIYDESGKATASIGMTMDITERKKIEEDIKRTNIALNAITKIQNEALKCETLEEVGRACLCLLEKQTDSKFGFINILNNNGTFDALAISNPGWVDCQMAEAEKQLFLRGMKVHGFRGRITKTGVSEIINAPSEDPDSTGIPEGHPPLTSFLGVPLLEGNKVIGLIALGNKDGGYDDDDFQFVETLSRTIVETMRYRMVEKDRTKYQQQLLQSQKMESIGHLAGGVAHDFNNMLGIIMGSAQLTEFDLKPGSSAHEEVSVIKDTVKRAKDLASKLLTFARKENMNIQTIDLNALVAEIISVLGRTTVKTIKVMTELSKDVIQIPADKNQIYQSIINVCNNAVDAMADKGTLTITTGKSYLEEKECKVHDWLKPGDYCFIKIRDTGVGVPQENVNQIFDPFYTTKGIGKGTGLGLSVTHGIIKSHGGHLSIESEPGKGTEITIWLPESQGKSAEIEADYVGSVAPGYETVLIIDDEEYILKTTEKLLQKQGYKTIASSASKEAIEVYRKNKEKIDIVILDYIMPDKDASDVYEELKKIKPDAKVIIASGFSSEGSIDNILKSGAKGYIQKPYEIYELCKAIRDVMDE